MKSFSCSPLLTDLPGIISCLMRRGARAVMRLTNSMPSTTDSKSSPPARSEEHTSELQSPCNLVCRLLLEKKNAYRAAEVVRQRVHLGHPFGGGLPPRRFPLLLARAHAPAPTDTVPLYLTERFTLLLRVL